MGCQFSSTALVANGVITNPAPETEGLAEGSVLFQELKFATFSCPDGFIMKQDGILVDSFAPLFCADHNEGQAKVIEAPSLSCEDPSLTGSGIMGEPHVKKWNGEWYDWQGECDAVFLHVPDFRDGLGLDIHTRTTIRYDYSFIETAAIQIGADILEVSSFGDYMLNGIAAATMPQVMGDCCNVTHTQLNQKQHSFSIHMGEGVSLELSTHKDIVSLKILHGSSPVVDEWFGSSSGLMGSFHESKTLTRDGVTLLEDPNELGQEWQVLDSDPKLFQNTDRAPQFPEKCRLPDAAAAQKRRLLGGAVSRDEAAEACAHWNEDERKNCIADVLATNDLELAEEYNGY